MHHPCSLSYVLTQITQPVYKSGDENQWDFFNLVYVSFMGFILVRNFYSIFLTIILQTLIIVTFRNRFIKI